MKLNKIIPSIQSKIHCIPIRNCVSEASLWQFARHCYARVYWNDSMTSCGYSHSTIGTWQMFVLTNKRKRILYTLVRISIFYNTLENISSRACSFKLRALTFLKAYPIMKCLNINYVNIILLLLFSRYLRKSFRGLVKRNLKRERAILRRLCDLYTLN